MITQQKAVAQRANRLNRLTKAARKLLRSVAASASDAELLRSIEKTRADIRTAVASGGAQTDRAAYLADVLQVMEGEADLRRSTKAVRQ